ncbi:MAG: bifunctional folylpolyglutamate synthase/dihydrofolate synthase [Gammaproteobacteria bacterium]|nr:bifunctional folylpolyglutamate synthase/dihydrofolate synthase [Gammaproteobacteria bacterium]
MRFSSLEQWLAWQESLHPTEIELGLARVRSVDQALSTEPLAPVVIIVGGTNGKGSTLAFLQAIYLAAGYRVGTYTSPHLMSYNERVCLNGVPVSDQLLCEAFERVDQARIDTSLTYFEFGTLAAFDIFRKAKLDVVLLEVGLGGRLDAVNIAEPSLSIITSIGLDHTDWLGDTREAICAEKLGIARKGKDLVIGEPKPPQNMSALIERMEAHSHRFNKDFSFELMDTQWTWHGNGNTVPALPFPGLRGQFQFVNASVAIEAVILLHKQLPVGHSDIRTGIANARILGRLECIDSPTHRYWLDIAHNAHAIESLVKELERWPHVKTRVAVFGVMRDKDYQDMLKMLLPHIDLWYLCGLNTPRALVIEELRKELPKLEVEQDRSACLIQ